MKSTERIEQLLHTIDTLGMAKIRHLQQIHDLKSYRNACRVVGQLKPYTNETYVNREKVIYLNKAGRERIGSTKKETKQGQVEHTLLRNDVYLYFRCPFDWKQEHPLETVKTPPDSLGITSKGVLLGERIKVVTDAYFERNGYIHLIEIDNEQSMYENKRKISSYKELIPTLPLPAILYFFTKTKTRKKKLEELCKGMRHEVKMYDEIR